MGSGTLPEGITVKSFLRTLASEAVDLALAASCTPEDGQRVRPRFPEAPRGTAKAFTKSAVKAVIKNRPQR